MIEKPPAEAICQELLRFIRGSQAGLLQLLVAAAQKKTFQRILECPTYPVPAKSTGLSSAVKQFLEMTYWPKTHVPTLLARLYLSVRSLKERKRTGQFFTAESVAAWALSIGRLTSSDNICDAGAGTGVFADAIFRNGGSVQSYIGVENDPILALCAAHVLESLKAPESYKIWYANFLNLKRTDFTAKGLAIPNTIISNPPFVRSRNLTGRARISASLRSGLGVTLSSLAGSGSYFISRAAEIAGASLSQNESPNGQLLFFLPQEAAGAGHVTRLLTDLRRTHGWCWQQLTIPSGQTGIDKHPSNALALLFLFEQQKTCVQPQPRKSKPAACVQDVVRVRRGISTGFNEFFILTDEEVGRRKIPRARLSAVLPTRISFITNNFSSADWDRLRLSNRPCWLLTLPNGDIEDFEPAVQEYLKEGIRLAVHETPTAKLYRTWFSIPVPDAPPDIFITYMFRGLPRIILNEAHVFYLTNILGGRFVTPIASAKRRQMIVESLNNHAKQWIRRNKAGRQYKGGLMKIEPKELSRLPIDFSLLKLFNKRKQEAVPGSLFD